MKFKIGITGTGSLIGQGIIKCIKNSQFSTQYNLVGFDYFENTVGSFWCDSNYILPDILKKEISEEEWLDTLLSKIEDEKLDVLFVGVDFELPILSKKRTYIEETTGCKIMVSSERVIEIGNDKYLTYQFLKKNHLSYPYTFLPEEKELKKLNFPLIVKPRVGARSVGVYKVENTEDMVEKLKKVKEPIVQEYIGDEGTEYTCGIICFEGELKAMIPLRRSLKGGNTFISEYNESFSEKITNYVQAIAKYLQPYGSCNLQLRVDKDGEPKLFEINPRHSGTTYMRSLFGYNEIIFILKYLLEQETIDFTLRNGKAMRYYEEKLIK